MKRFIVGYTMSITDQVVALVAANPGKTATELVAFTNLNRGQVCTGLNFARKRKQVRRIHQETEFRKNVGTWIYFAI